MNRFEYEVVDHVGVSGTKEEEMQMAQTDLSRVVPKFEVDPFLFVLTPDPDKVSGSCGEYKSPAQYGTLTKTDNPPKGECWQVPDECAKRGYSDYRWRVNRTLQGVMIHELGHHLERQLYQKTDVTLEEVKSLFPEETDITNYSDKNYAENFAESWRVFVTNPLLLNAINPQKYNFFLTHFNHELSGDYEWFEDSFETMNGIVRNQLETASTNSHIREFLEAEGINYSRDEDA